MIYNYKSPAIPLSFIGIVPMLPQETNVVIPKAKPKQARLASGKSALITADKPVNKLQLFNCGN